jgi:RecA-family ATPase
MMTTTQRDATRLETISLAGLLEHDFPTREDLIFPWLRQGESAMLWAAPGTGKTLLTITLALMVAGGGSVLGWASPKPRKVLLVDGEMAAEDLKERAVMLIDTITGIDKAAAGRNLMILSRNWQVETVVFPDLGDRCGAKGKPSGQDVFVKAARDHGAELVFLDNYSTLAEVSDENDAAAMTPTLTFLLRLKQARIGCVLVHHSGKSGETYRGSSKLATTFEVILGLKAAEGATETGGAAFRLDWTKFRRERCEAVQARDVRLGKDAKGLPQWGAVATADDDIRRLLAELKTFKHSTQKDLGAALGWDKTKVSKMKRRIMETGVMSEKDWDANLAEKEKSGGDTDPQF